jgi:hypothetical protein
MPRFAALVVDGAVGYTVFVVSASAWLPDRITGLVIVMLPLLIVPWEAAWLRFTGGTVGHWLAGIGLVWPKGAPGFGRLCWRTVKRYALFWMISGQPSNVAPGALLVDTVRPVSFGRVSRLIDGDGIVASRGWSVARASAVFALCLAIPVLGVVTAANLDPPPLCEDIRGGPPLPREEAERANRSNPGVAALYDCDPNELRNPLLGASLVWMAGAVMSVISVVDARQQHREREPVRSA